MRHVLALAVAATLLSAGCADSRSGSLGPAPSFAPAGERSASAPAATPPGTPAPPTRGPASPPPPPRTGAATTGERAGTITIQLWFARAGRLAPTRRTRPATLATSRLALTELTAGPTAAEQRAGMSTALPAEPGFAVVGIDDRVATVEFAPAFSTGSTATVRLRQAQVVYTLTQFPTVARVQFRSGGDPAGAPAGRSAYADLLPPIVVLDPVIGQRVTSPITVTGTADVFEATVSVRLLDGGGRQLATAFTTATCGTGCRGSYRLTLAYRSGAGGAGTVEVYQVSAQDGSRRDVVALPVRLAASL